MDSAVLLTEQLQRFAEGDREMAETVLRLVLPELHRIAVRELGKERHIAPVTPHELINEAWVRSLHKGGWQINSRGHFYAIAALAMRRVLVDFARQRLAQRRGNGEAPLPLDNVDQAAGGMDAGPEKLVEMGILMEQLEREDSKAASVVDMHYFTGFTLDEIAEITGLRSRHITHLWRKGRDWLKDRLQS